MDFEVPAVGAFLLGVFVGYLVWYFLVRFEAPAFNTKVLASVISVAAGGAIAAFLDVDPSDRWWYPIGLIAGWGIFTIGRTFATGEIPSFPRIHRKPKDHESQRAEQRRS